MSQLNGRMWYLEGKIVQYQQAVAASDSPWPPRPTSQPSQQSQAVSSQGVARALSPPHIASDTATGNEHIRDKEITDLKVYRSKKILGIKIYLEFNDILAERQTNKQKTHFILFIICLHPPPSQS